MIGIELDGKYHNEEEQKGYDRERNEYLKSVGIILFHIKNSEITSQLEKVIMNIVSVLSDANKQYQKDRII